MRRTYLEEDLELIRSYFPGARTTNLRTPFDLTEPAQRPGVARAGVSRSFFQGAASSLDDWGRGGASWTF